MRRALLALLVGAAALTPLAASGQDTRRIEVVEVKGIIDGNVERSILTTLKDAQRDKAELVLLQIDSRGNVGGPERLVSILNAIADSHVPVGTWVGPAGARAENGAAVVALAGHVRAIAPGATIGPIENVNLSKPTGGVFDSDPQQIRLGRNRSSLNDSGLIELIDRLSASQAEGTNLVFGDERVVADLVTPAIAELLEDVDGQRIVVNGSRVRLSTDPDESSIRFHKGDLLGRALHAAGQPSIVYLLILLGLVGIVFELFHPSTGPAGISGLVALGLAVYGIVTLGGSWIGFALIVIGVIGFCLDLRFQSLSFPTVLGFVALVAGSLLLFPGASLSVSPWVLAFGIVSMVAFLLGAMTRVLRDLRAVARGELEVTEAHQHPSPNGHGDGDAP